MPVASQIDKLSRESLAKLHSDFDPVADAYPEIKGALARLDEAVAEELPGSQGSRWHDNDMYERRLKRVRNQRDFERRRRRLTEAKLHELVQAKQVAGGQGPRLTIPFIVKVCLSKPTTSLRSFQETFADLVGFGDKTSAIGRSTITSIRDAFANACVQLTDKAARAAMERHVARRTAALGASSAAPCAGVPRVASVCLLHITDEAALRLRSFASTDAKAPVRSRTSKVQQHAASVHFGNGEQRVVDRAGSAGEQNAPDLGHDA